MNNTARKLFVPLCILLAALAFWLPAQLNLLRARGEMDAARARLADLRDRIAAGQAELNQARQRKSAQILARDRASASAAKAERELAKIDPESRWALPPAALPEWNRDSPYVWLPKELAAHLRMPIFKRNGQLRDDAAAILGVDEQSRRALDSQVGQLLSNYHALEVSNAVRLDAPPAGMNSDGPAVTVQLNAMPDVGAECERQFTNVLQQTLGQQRAALVNQSAQDWLGDQFHHFGTAPETISVVHHPKGGFSVNIDRGQYGNSSMGLNGDDPAALGNYIPDYLLPLFSDVTPAAAPGQ
ncbi:MAG: hypothetical protein ABSG59_19375 [Verrucomicrobiota bacterium]|jgi:hypothetical protein